MEIKLDEKNIYSRGYILEFEEGNSLLKRIPTTYNPSASKDKTHIVKRGDTLYGLADKFYGSDQWWHILGDVNEVYNPFDLTDGQELLIPDLDIIKASRK